MPMFRTNRTPRANGCTDQEANLTGEYQLLATLPAMLFTSRPDGFWDYINPPFCAYTGYPQEALMGLGWAEILHADDRTLSLSRWHAAIGCGTPLQVEHRLLHADGKHYWFRTHCTPQHNAMGAITRWAGITAPVEIPPEVADERALRRSAELARDSVIAIAAHELRAPMTVLLGQAQLHQRRLVSREHVDPNDLRAATTLVEQSLQLSRLIHALLNTAEVDHGQLQISVAPLDLAALVRQIVELLQPTLPTHILHLSTDVSSLWVAGDSMRLEQVLQNLLQNAVLYSPAGSEIEVVVTSHGDQAQVSVRDYGCGIAPNLRPALFRRFVRTRSGDSTTTSGMGLGLYICKTIMELHAGSIDVESTAGDGSTFTLLLPKISELAAHSTVS